MEIKFIIYNKIFNTEQKLPSCIFKQQSYLNMLAITKVSTTHIEKLYTVKTTIANFFK